MIQNPLEEDLTNEQLTLKEHMDPFTGSNREQAKENSRFKRLPVVVMRWQTLSTPSRGQQVLTPLGSVQTTSLLVVLIRFHAGLRAF